LPPDRLYRTGQIFGGAFRQYVAAGPDGKINSIETHLLHGVSQFRVIQLRQMLGEEAERWTARQGAGAPVCQHTGSRQRNAREIAPSGRVHK
jgi:hypothetical protein